MVIRELFNDYGMPGCRTGNLYLSGYSAMGAEECFVQLYKEMLEERVPVFLINRKLSSVRAEAVCREAVGKGFRAYRINGRSSICYPFDLLKLGASDQEKADLVYGFLADPSDSSSDTDMICRYFRNCVHYLGEAFPDRPVTLQRVLSLRIEEVRDGIGRSMDLDPMEIAEECSFLDSRDLYRLWGLVSDRARALEGTGLIRVLSGTADPRDVFRGPILLVLSCEMETPERARIYDRILTGFLPVLSRICGGLASEGRAYHIFIHGSGSVSTVQLESLLALGCETEDTVLPVCLYEQSVSRLVRSHGEAVLQSFASVGVFRTNEGNFWSDFFGTSLMPEVSRSYSRRRGIFLGSALETESVVGRPRGRFEGTTVQRVEKPVYEARVFQALRDREMIFYSAFRNIRRRRQLHW